MIALSSSFQPETGSAMQQTAPVAVSKEERNWAMLAHLSGLFSLTGIFPLLAAFVIWLLRKEDRNFASAQAREALNFQVTMFISFVICWVLTIIWIGALLFGLVALFDLVFSIIAAVKASEGIPYRYPFNLRLVS
jgi:uncharacterized Tic20 family protein